jgi:hypothetical protein
MTRWRKIYEKHKKRDGYFLYVRVGGRGFEVLLSLFFLALVIRNEK